MKLTNNKIQDNYFRKALLYLKFPCFSRFCYFIPDEQIVNNYQFIQLFYSLTRSFRRNWRTLDKRQVVDNRRCWSDISFYFWNFVVIIKIQIFPKKHPNFHGLLLNSKDNLLLYTLIALFLIKLHDKFNINFN